jgi:hypothetical protein
VGKARHRHSEVAGDPGGELDVAGQPLGGVDDVDHSGVAEGAETEPKVHRRADHDDEIGLAERRPPGSGEDQLVVGRHTAPAHAVLDHRRLDRLGQRAQRLPGAAEPDVGAGDQQRTIGSGERLGGRGQRVAVHLARCGPRWVGDGSLVGGGEDDIQGHVHEGGAAVGGRRGAHRGGHLACDLAGVGGGGRMLGERGHERHVVELLEAAPPPVRLRRPTAEHHQRRPAGLS